MKRLFISILSVGSLFTLCSVLDLDAASAGPSVPVSNQDGKYSDANGDPTYHIGKDGKTDWYTYSGFLRYHSECHVCHGPDGMGSTYAPPLKDSLKTLSYTDFLATVAQGRKNLENGQEKVMPELGLNKNVMCYIDDIYTYLKARSDGAVDRGRPQAHEPKPKAWQDAQDSCMGPRVEPMLRLIGPALLAVALGITRRSFAGI